MELRHLRYFVAVAEERHFGRAAARLHMAQPPLSQQVRQLEAELGVRLLHRTTRRVDLTEAGAAYLERARAILGEVEEAGHQARRVAAGLVGAVSIGCVGSATYSLLPALARALRAELPGIDFTFRGEMLVPDQVAALGAGTLDVALLRPPVLDLDLRVRRVRTERLIVALPSTHPLTAKPRVRVADLAGEDLIVHAGRSVMYDQVLGLCREAGFEPRVAQEVEETSTLVTFVAAGLGLAVVPEPVSSLALGGVAYRPLVGPVRRVELAVATRSEESASIDRVLAVLEGLAAG